MDLAQRMRVIVSLLVIVAGAAYGPEPDFWKNRR